jgi:hypothetical protein
MKVQVRIEYKDGWAQKPAWAFRLRENLIHICKCDWVRGLREHPVAVVNGHTVFFLEAERLDSEFSSYSKHGIVQMGAIPIHRNKHYVWQPVIAGIVWMSTELIFRCSHLARRSCAE